MELPRIVEPGGMREADDVTSAAVSELDLTTFIGRYVTLTWDQAMYFSLAPATGTFTLDSGTGDISASVAPTSGAIVPERVARDATTGLAQARDVFVSNLYPRLLMRAQSASATYTEVKVTSARAQGF